jgi:hypothetical protein
MLLSSPFEPVVAGFGSFADSVFDQYAKYRAFRAAAAWTTRLPRVIPSARCPRATRLIDHLDRERFRRPELEHPRAISVAPVGVDRALPDVVEPGWMKRAQASQSPELNASDRGVSVVCVPPLAEIKPGVAQPIREGPRLQESSRGFLGIRAVPLRLRGPVFSDGVGRTSESTRPRGMLLQSAARRPRHPPLETDGTHWTPKKGTSPAFI